MSAGLDGYATSKCAMVMSNYTSHFSVIKPACASKPITFVSYFMEYASNS